MAALRTVVANPALRRIEVAWTLGTAGDAAFLVALVVAAFGWGGTTAVAVLTAVRMAPSIVGAPLAGLVAGRRPPTRLLLIVHATRAAAAIVGTLALVAAIPAGVLVAAIVSASAGAFVRPLQAASMPGIARSPEELVAVNVASGTGEGLGAFGGPLVAGVLVAAGGPIPAALGACVMFAVGAAALAVAAESSDSHAADEADRRSAAGAPVDVGAVAAELTAGVRALARHRGAAAILVDLAGQVFVRGLQVALMAVTAIELVHLGEPGVGTLAAAYGLGTLVGAVAASRTAVSGRLGSTMAVAVSLWGLPLAVIAAVPSPIVAIGAFAVSGLANGTLDVAAFTLLQRCVPRADRVAVLGLLEAIVALGVAAGSALAPVLVASFGVRGALAIAGAILPILAVATWSRIRRVEGEAIVPERQLRLLRGIPLFAPLPLTALERLAEATRPARSAAGTTIVRQGEPGRDYFVIERGEVEVRVDDRPIARGGPGDGFGEIALVRDVPRTATVVAVTDVELEVVDSADFLAAVAGPTSAAAAASVIDARLARSAATG